MSNAVALEIGELLSVDGEEKELFEEHQFFEDFLHSVWRKEKDAIAERLIRRHFEIAPTLKEVYRFFSGDEENPYEPIKLLEVNEESVETGRLEAFEFAPYQDITFPSVMAEVTNTEFKKIHEGLINLPEGWSLQPGRCRRYRPEDLPSIR